MTTAELTHPAFKNTLKNEVTGCNFLNIHMSNRTFDQFLLLYSCDVLNRETGVICSTTCFIK